MVCGTVSYCFSLFNADDTPTELQSTVDPALTTNRGAQGQSTSSIRLEIGFDSMNI